MWRKLFKWFGMKVVITQDCDKQTRYRFAFRDPREGWRARAIMGWVHLDKDGTCNTPAHNYVKKWKWA